MTRPAPRRPYAGQDGSGPGPAPAFRDNGDGTATDLNSGLKGTVTDAATGLMWQKIDDGVARDWRDALAYCEALGLRGHADRRLPDANELHTIVDYTRAPAATGGAAIAPPLQVSTTDGLQER
ncbi:MAG: DUF1566 domain-containing protein [Pseudomonadota bacterium]